jgi:hypothetical protein
MKATMNMGCKHAPRRATRLGQVVAAAVLIGASITTASALTVTGPSSVLMIDGKDIGTAVPLYISNSTITSAYDFGYVTGSGFQSLTWFTGFPAGSFGGGDVADFALRKKTGGTIYSMSDSAGYVRQIYSDNVTASNSVHPVVTTDYNRSLVLSWDLNHDSIIDGSISISTCGVISSLCATTNGMMAKPVAAVPLPAALPLFMTGASMLAGFSFRRKRASTV